MNKDVGAANEIAEFNRGYAFEVAYQKTRAELERRGYKPRDIEKITMGELSGFRIDERKRLLEVLKEMYREWKETERALS